MQTFRMSWLFMILFLSLRFNNLEARHHDNKKLPSIGVTGTVYYDTCFQRDFSTASHFISGASVAVECPDGKSKLGFREEVKTDEHGKFRVQLPSSISKHLRKINGCTVKLIRSSEPYCSVASSASSSSMHLKSTKQGEHIFSTGFYYFKPLKQPSLCNQKHTIQNSKGRKSVKTFQSPATDFTFPPPIQDPPTSDLPPLPELPPLPNLPQSIHHFLLQFHLFLEKPNSLFTQNHINLLKLKISSFLQIHRCHLHLFLFHFSLPLLFLILFNLQHHRLFPIHFSLRQFQHHCCHSHLYQD